MKKLLVLSGQVTLLTGAVSFGTMSLSSCSIEVWKSNIQLVCSPGGSKLADHSFQQNSFDGIMDFFRTVRYKDQHFVEPKPENNIDKLGGLWRHPIGYDGMQFMESYRDAYASGASTLVCTGFEQVTPLEEFTSADPKINARFPLWAQRLKNHIGIVYVDGSLNTNNFKSEPFNVSSVAFEADQAGVMAGILTGITLNIDDYYVPIDVDFGGSAYNGIKVGGSDKTTDVKSKYQGTWYKGKVFKIGGYVGLPGQSTLTFLNGWFQGANYFNNHWQELQEITEKIIEKHKNGSEQLATKDKQWYPLTVVGPTGIKLSNLTMDGFTAGSFSPVEPKAKALVNDYMKQGVSAFLPVAGPQDPLVVSEVAQKHEKMAVIGTDVALEDDDSVNQYLPNKNLKHSIIPFSIMKNLKGSVSSILKAIDGAMTSNKIDTCVDGYYGFGYNNWGRWDNKGVQVSSGKICYDTTSGKKYSETICAEIINAVSESMKVKPKPYELKGHELDQTAVASFQVVSGSGNKSTQNVISVPWIQASALGVNTYAVPDLQKAAKPVIDTEDFKNKISVFIKNLAAEIGTVRVGNEERRNWYLYRI